MEIMENSPAIWLYFLFVSVYYSQLYDGQYIGFDGMIRIFAGLAVGQLLFDFVELIKDKEIKTPVRIFCQIAEFFFVNLLILGKIMKHSNNIHTSFVICCL